MFTKEMICCTILIVVGCLTTISHSNAISESSSSSSSSSLTTAIHHDRTNFNKNGILRDGDDADNRHSVAESISGANNRKRSARNDNTADDSTSTGDAIDENDYSNDDDDDFVSIEIGDQLSLKDQVRMLTKQMSSFIQHKRNERKRLEEDIQIAIQKTARDLINSNIKAELEQLR